MNKIKLLTFALLAFWGAAASFGEGVKLSQQISLAKGWNAVYVRVAPEESADTLFANWPVDWVALYEPAAFVDTRQFALEGESEGTEKAGYRVWRRNDRSASTFSSVPANSVLIAFAETAWSCEFVGTPVAPRIIWHDSLSKGAMNFAFFSTYSDTLTDTYFSGLDVGDGPFYVLSGKDKASPRLFPATMVGAKHYKDGEVLLVDSKKTSDWSGVMNVSPARGIDFGTGSSVAKFEIRNDSTGVRTFSFRLRKGDVPALGGLAPELPPRVLVRDLDTAVTNAEWWTLYDASDDGEVKPDETGEGEFVWQGVARKTLSSNETWRLQIAVDRTKFLLPTNETRQVQVLAPSGTVYGAIGEFRDETPAVLNAQNKIEGGSHMQAFVPITATADGGAAAETAWPRGLWILSASLDTVTFVGDSATYKGVDSHELPAGGRMKVRLIVYVDGDGHSWLLQRFAYGRNTNGVMRVYSGAVTKSGEPLYGAKRFSTPFLPTDLPPVRFDGSTNSFGSTSATVSFRVANTSFVNPMYHARHPSHDGLSADYSESAPDGDSFENYLNTIKPETFSIKNDLEFAWDTHNASTWRPEETLTGKLTWQFSGLRSKDVATSIDSLRAIGPFTMKRIYAGKVKLEE